MLYLIMGRLQFGVRHCSIMCLRLKRVRRAETLLFKGDKSILSLPEARYFKIGINMQGV